MVIRLPTDLESKWKQPNNSDKFGSVWYSKNMNFDEEGYAKLSPRTINVADEASNSDFGVPIAIGRFGFGDYQVATDSNANFDVGLSTTTISANENSGTNEPTLTSNSHALIWQSLWHASTATAVLSRVLTGGSNEAWTSRITGLTSGVRHYMEAFTNLKTLCVTNANTVAQYSTGYSITGLAQLVIPSDFEAVGLAYNNGVMGVITRLGSSSEGQNSEAYFFEWNGLVADAQKGYGVGSDACLAICAYKSSFAILTRAGQLLYYNGGGFDVLASFPFFYQDKIFGSFLNSSVLGDNMLADGDVIYINLGMDINEFNRKTENTIINCPSGLWCFDPEVGLYHRASPSLSKAYANTVSDANVNITTDLFTITSGTIPATGNIARLTVNDSSITGILINQDYYIIKVSSTTFKLATTKANAIAGTAIDITAVGSGGSKVFWMFDLVDYGVSYYDDTGCVALVGETTQVYQDFLIGAEIVTLADAVNDNLSVSVPYLENRGYFVTPKIFSSGVKDNAQKVFLKFRPLKTTDSIVVSARNEDIVGLPVSSSGSEANWTSPTEFYTTQDLSEAKTYFDAGGKLEVELISGAGAGQSVVVSDIDTDNTTYNLVLEEEVVGASSGVKSEFFIMNWGRVKTITSSDKSPVEFPLGGSASWEQFKVELRGSDVAIEEVQYVNPVQQKST